MVVGRQSLSVCHSPADGSGLRDRTTRGELPCQLSSGDADLTLRGQHEQQRRHRGGRHPQLPRELLRRLRPAAKTRDELLVELAPPTDLHRRRVVHLPPPVAAPTVATKTPAAGPTADPGRILIYIPLVHDVNRTEV